MLIPEPELSSDLEWLLQSTQGSPALLMETVYREYGAFIYRLGQAQVGEASAAQVLQDTLLAIVKHRRRYRPEVGLKSWVCLLALQACSRLVRPSLATKTALHAARDASLWPALDNLGERLRKPALLYYICELSPGEIARVLELRESEVQARLNTTRLALAACLPESETAGQVDARLRRSLLRRWPLPEAGDATLEQAAAAAFTRLKHSQLHASRLGRLVQMAFIAVILILIVGAGWLTRQVATSSIPQIRQVVVTQIVRVPVTRTPAPAPTLTPTRPPLQSLVFDASEAAIRQRMSVSRSLWPGAYVEAQLVHYGPPDYIGPPRIFRNQVWVQNPTQSQTPERMLLLTGGPVEPSRAQLVQGADVYEIDLLSGLSYRRTLNEPSIPTFYSSAQMFLMGNDVLGVSSFDDGSALIRMLFAEGLAASEGQLSLAFTARMLGRDTLVVEHTLGGVLRERFWVDALVGLVLRWERYAAGSQRTVTDEIAVTQLDFEADFPDEVLSTTFFWRSPLAWDVLRRGAHPGRSFAAPLNTRQRRSEPPPPPPDFDPAGAPLAFQWSLAGSRGLLPGSSAEIFAGGYLLGVAEMGDPWDLVCKRSPDGRSIAFLEGSGVPAGLFASAGPFWLDLADPSVVHNALPNAEVVSSDFAFSPDGRRLAFWGCGGAPGNCGIYIHDLQTRINRKLGALDDGAAFFTWSLDGMRLALVGARSAPKFATSFIVLNVDSAVIEFESPVSDWPYQIPGDAPAWSRENSLGSAPRGLEGCSGRPGS